MNLINKWTQHLKENDMSYVEHLIFASYYSLVCMVSAFCFLLHAILPCFLQKTGSNLVKKLNHTFNKNEPN